MKIEKELFAKTHVDFEKLREYGFQKNKENYVFSKLFMNDDFRADIMIDPTGNVFGKVIDMQIGEEYTSFRVETNHGAFVSKIRDMYQDILVDIKKQCFHTDYFRSEQANRIAQYIIHKYGDEPEFLWDRFPEYGVFRNKDNHKWYGAIMNIDRSKLDHGTGEVEIIDVKSDESMIQTLMEKDGYYPGYHMNKRNWITIILNNTLDDEEIIKRIDESYYRVKGK